MIGDSCRDRTKIRQHRIKQRRVEGVRHRQRLGTDAICCELRRKGLHCIGSPGDHHAGRAVHRCDGNRRAIRRDGLTHPRLGGGDSDHRSIRRQFPHQSPACCHQLEAIFQAEDSR